ncbi:hypothetical protein TPHA_0B01220 [Tetrapisispora phaffii CBS 4417]|uniref:Uncharacterized protein n=1 Tax=Tetrapisispora phaffii (strain ATCC 24235 / CBS 4417 / NBRC 1672 / NRRL Y-8282 / UCD 70-5) TaxID=1071381 RepID=G8BP63_TETPH|nr:hypothetical protein TPHA_0B01220 [Tetrapisispora phaffii CBS 4417]CCE61794.1 hypothetical protein TPHA_0B01220 [Tetrapisispora phaffii CBS 4417]
MSSNTVNVNGQVKKNKLSVWVKKIMQAKDNNSSTIISAGNIESNNAKPKIISNTPALPTVENGLEKSNSNMASEYDDAYTMNSSLRPLFDLESKYNNSNNNNTNTSSQNENENENDRYDDHIMSSPTYNHRDKPSNTSNHSNKQKLQKLSWDERPKKDYTIQGIDNASIQPLLSICSSSIKSSIFSDTNSLQSTKATITSARTQETNSSTIAIPPASILDRSRYSSSTNNNTNSNTGTSTNNSIRHPHLHRVNSNRTSASIMTIKS